ncbi:biliverdin-producing heme oxygenase [Flavobacterium hercynium]|uniref:Heme oxygenase n=1 Tax=Flavobacterium hercynium TaxID=387094 RepID=A0A226H5D6_9FLAO|nr:biliverdin-producing heme oxygenase [Flavobacterium hercynium]OXA89529.1 hypothetical protein B0A66_14000 [Flavobacterium hercynium]SMP35963.1 heme oxygenase [Flavobacterium hercynium]
MTTNSDISQPFLSNLKTKTASSHQKLESLPVSASILSPNMKMNDYAHYLSLMHDVHTNLEEEIFPLLTDIIDDLKAREKKELLEADLSYLNYTKTNSNRVFNKEKVSTAFALGIFYVVEGSTLGGRFILKNLETIPGLTEEKGVSYFNGYGNKTGSYWKSFLNLLSTYEEEHNCENEIIDGAIYAFDCIHDHFLNTRKNEN